MCYGFFAGAVFGPFVGSIADKFGKKLMCQIFCGFYVVNCCLMHFSNYMTLATGQLLNGISTRILYSCFEAWYIGEHSNRNYSGDKLGNTLGWMYLGHSIMAISAGGIAYLMPNYVSPELITLVPAWEPSNGDPSDADKQWMFGIYFGHNISIYLVMIATAIAGFFVVTFGWKEVNTPNVVGKDDAGLVSVVRSFSIKYG